MAVDEAYAVDDVALRDEVRKKCREVTLDPGR